MGGKASLAQFWGGNTPPRGDFSSQALGGPATTAKKKNKKSYSKIRYQCEGGGVSARIKRRPPVLVGEGKRDAFFFSIHRRLRPSAEKKIFLTTCNIAGAGNGGGNRGVAALGELKEFIRWFTAGTGPTKKTPTISPGRRPQGVPQGLGFNRCRPPRLLSRGPTPGRHSSAARLRWGPGGEKGKDRGGKQRKKFPPNTNKNGPHQTMAQYNGLGKGFFICLSQFYLWNRPLFRSQTVNHVNSSRSV